jgi:hypothetical protein
MLVLQISVCYLVYYENLRYMHLLLAMKGKNEKYGDFAKHKEKGMHILFVLPVEVYYMEGLCGGCAKRKEHSVWEQNERHSVYTCRIHSGSL